MYCGCTCARARARIQLYCTCLTKAGLCTHDVVKRRCPAGTFGFMLDDGTAHNWTLCFTTS